MSQPKRSSSLQVTEIKAFVPAKNFALSKQYYLDLGFTMASEGGGIAYFHFEQASFLFAGLLRAITGREFHDAYVGEGCGRLVESGQRKRGGGEVRSEIIEH